MSFRVVEVKDIYNNQSKTMQARSATHARYPAAATDRSRRAEDLRSEEVLVDKPEKNVRAASKAETFFHIPQEMMASGEGNEWLAGGGNQSERGSCAMRTCSNGQPAQDQNGLRRVQM
jgi:hypothetical protein